MQSNNINLKLRQRELEGVVERKRKYCENLRSREKDYSHMYEYISDRFNKLQSVCEQFSNHINTMPGAINKLTQCLAGNTHSYMTHLTAHKITYICM